MSTHQDWKQVTWVKNEFSQGGNKEVILNKARRAGASIDTEKKQYGGQNKTSKSFVQGNMAKVENETECFKIDRVAYDFRLALQRARLAKGMTQSQLARSINESESVIKEYENGSAIPNGLIIQKLNRILGSKLPPARDKRSG